MGILGFLNLVNYVLNVYGTTASAKVFVVHGSYLTYLIKPLIQIINNNSVSSLNFILNLRGEDICLLHKM